MLLINLLLTALAVISAQGSYEDPEWPGPPTPVELGVRNGGVTILEPSLQTSRDSSMIVARDAADCSKWYWLPTRWTAVANSRDAYVGMGWRKTGSLWWARRYPEAVYSLVYEPLPIASFAPELTRQLQEYVNTRVGLERGDITAGHLKAEEAFYAGVCRNRPIQLVPFPLEGFDMHTEDAGRQRTVNVHFMRDEQTAAHRLTIDVRSNPLLDGERDLDNFVRGGTGVLPIDGVAMLNTVASDVEGWLDVQSSAIAYFTQVAHHVQTCSTRCSSFLWWSSCRTQCSSRDWTDQFLSSEETRKNMSLYVKASDDNAGEKYTAASRELLGRFLVSNFMANSERDNENVRVVSLGTLVRAAASSYHSSFRRIKPGRVSLGGKLTVERGLPEELFKPLSDFVKSSAYQCAVKKGVDYLDSKCKESLK